MNYCGGDGAEVIYALRNNDVFASKIARELENAGQNIRKYYQRRLPSNPAKDYYYIMRDTPNNETVIVEYGFADSTGDDVEQLKNTWENLAEAVVKAITEYAGGTYTLPNKGNYYIVKSGDSLWSISKKTDVSIAKIKELNNLKSNLLSIGQKLTLPQTSEDTPSLDTYIVQKGDSLYKIANKFNTTVDNLKLFNNLQSNNLAIGQKLKVSSSENKYTVQKGDTLYSIATKFSVSVDSLKNANNLVSNTIAVGQSLIIPEQKKTKTYTVQKGDNLYSIARRYNTTVNTIMSLNNLASTNLTIGQKLLVP